MSEAFEELKEKLEERKRRSIKAPEDLEAKIESMLQKISTTSRGIGRSNCSIDPDAPEDEDDEEDDGEDEDDDEDLSDIDDD